MTAPFDMLAIAGNFWGYLVFLLIGISFGVSLEMSGFGDSRKLSSQFYFRDMTVLKVMFTAIITASVLLYFFNSFGLLAIERIYINHTYLWPGIIGGIIMGFGFIIGGFCPGTSIVAFSTLKIDGIFFAGGVAFGIFVFGETVSLFTGFWNSSYMGRLTIPEVMNLRNGIIVLAVSIMALGMFYGSEILEQIFGKKIKPINFKPRNKYKIAGAVLLLLVSLSIIIKGDPTPFEKWARLPEKEHNKITKREVFIHPGELIEAANDDALFLNLIDIRDEHCYNLFHLKTAHQTKFENISTINFLKKTRSLPGNNINILIANDEENAIKAYKILKGQGIINLYILEGGMNNWLATFAHDVNEINKNQSQAPEELHYNFSRARGDTYEIAQPVNMKPWLKQLKYSKKIKVEKKSVLKGGCG